MHNKIVNSFAAVAIGAMALTSCSSKLGNLGAENFTVDPTPLELIGGNVPVTINGVFPEKYMKKKAVVTVVPELRNAKGKVIRGEGRTFQGEKVLGNDQQISYILGGRYTMRDAFAYDLDMMKSDLYLTFDAKVGKKSVTVPDVKVGRGIIATSDLYREALKEKGGIIAPDSFQRVKKEKCNASVNFLINQAKLRSSELKNNSVQEFVALLNTISKEAEKYNISDIEVRGYASPEGKTAFNDKLASQRQAASQKYVEAELAKANLQTNVTGQYTAEDWEGFQKIVQVSDIQDKDLILRVLNMYKDPQEREQQIRNLSKGFRDLADQILPRLRRARMIASYEIVGRSDDQIEAAYNSDPSSLSAEELLYYAALCNEISKKEEVYKKCASLYPNDYRALNNIAAMEFAKGDNASATSYIQKALGKNRNAGECQSNLALIALQQGDVKSAEAYLSKAGNSTDVQFVQAAVDFAKGNYRKAMEVYSDDVSNMSALTGIMAKDYDDADATLQAIDKDGDALTDYLRAVLAARLGQKQDAATYLKSALKKNPSLKAYADNDIELEGI